MSRDIKYGLCQLLSNTLKICVGGVKLVFVTLLLDNTLHIQIM